MTKIIEISSKSFSFTFSPDGPLAHLEDPVMIMADLPRASGDLEHLKEAADILEGGDVVAIPTETVYGLSADATRDTSVKRIFKAKNRPSDNPLIVHVSSLRMARTFCMDHTIPSLYSPLIQRFWPGPLTILVPKSDDVPKAVTGPNDSISTVALRFPSNIITRALIQTLGKPLAAPSANLSGKPSPTCAKHVFADMNGIIQLIISDLDNPICAFGLESTVIDAVSSYPPVILRPGAITLEMIREVPGFEECVGYSREMMGNQEFSPTTPGMKYRHYSPRNAKVVLFENPGQDFDVKIRNKVRDLLSINGKLKLGVIRNVNVSGLPEFTGEDEVQISKGLKYDNEIDMVDFYIRRDEENKLYSRHLFEGLRYLDEQDSVDYILIHGVDEKELGMALMNRIRKASFDVVY